MTTPKKAPRLPIRFWLAFVISLVVGVGALPQSGLAASSNTLVIGVTKPVRGFTAMDDRADQRIDDLVSGNAMSQLDNGSWVPELLESQPKAEDGTWILHGDPKDNNETTEVIYKFKKGITWHDGTPFTTKDVLFWREVALDKDVPWVQRHWAEEMKSMEAIDDLTLRVVWDHWFTDATTITHRHLQPLPRQILENLYRTDKQRFINNPYWTTKYVGLGPYKVVEFVAGDYITLTAYEGYVPEPAKIKNIVVRMLSSDVIVSELLAGKIDVTSAGGASGGGISFDDGMILAKQWGNSGKGKLVFNPTLVTAIAFQMRDEWRGNKAIGDVRVRRALLQAIDRKAVIDTLFAGLLEVANTWVPTTSPVYSLFKEHATFYPYDPAKAEQLLAEAGWKKGAGGLLRSAAGEAFKLELRAAGGHDDMMTIIAEYWKKIGVDVSLLVVPAAREKDAEWMAKFPGVINHDWINEPVGGGLHRFGCKTMPVAEEKYAQFRRNLASFCDTKMEELYWKTRDAFPFSVAWQPFAEMQEIALRDLPYLPLYLELEVAAVRSKVQGFNALAQSSLEGRSYSRPFMQAHHWTVTE